jgi:hypothetical protein
LLDLFSKVLRRYKDCRSGTRVSPPSKKVGKRSPRVEVVIVHKHEAMIPEERDLTWHTSILKSYPFAWKYPTPRMAQTFLVCKIGLA